MNPIDNAIVLEEAKKYTDKICRVETKTISWDGDTTGKTLLSGEGIPLYKVSDDCIDVKDITKVVIYVIADNGAEGFTDADKVFGSISGPVIMGVDDFGLVLTHEDGEELVVTVKSDIIEDGVTIKKGTYFRGLWRFQQTASRIRVASVTTETIHPIDPKFLLPSRYLLNLSSVTIQQGDSVIRPSIYDFVALAAQNGGSFNTTIPAENCKELVTKATEWAKLSRGEDWNWLTSAPQLVVCDNIGILLMPTAIEHQHSTDPGLLQIFVGGTLRVKNGTTWITTNANCTIFFNEDGSIDMFVTATAV